MTYCEVGLARSFCWAYYWWESNKSRAKNRERRKEGKEGRRRFFDGTNCQFQPIHRSSPPPRHAQEGFPSLRLRSLGSGLVKVGSFTSLRSKRDGRALPQFFYPFRPRRGKEHLAASLEESSKLAPRNFLRLSNQLRVPQDARSPVPSRTAKLFGSTALHRGRAGRQGTVIGGKAAVNFSAFLFFHPPAGRAGAERLKKEKRKRGKRGRGR